MKTTCSTCGAEIIWAKIDGKAIPLNKRRVRAYRQMGDVMRSGERTDGDDEWFFENLVHISHFVTCPQASQHSKKGR